MGNSDRTSLGDRMKRYEEASRTVLPDRLPIIIRIDGKAFHTYTRGCQRPFDTSLADVMVATARQLCEEVQGAQLAYTQSDEISLLVHGYKRFNSSSWFDRQVQKTCSVAAAVASATFTAQSYKIWRDSSIRPAVFDARAFVVPESDVCNYFLWRQQDCARNSVQQLARSLFSHAQCQGKPGTELVKMCEQAGHPWNMLEQRWTRGSCIVRTVDGTYQDSETGEVAVARGIWYVDHNIPVFSRDRDYVNRHLALIEE